MQPLVVLYLGMGILEVIRNSIGEVGVNEVARRTGLAASTVSRIGAGQVVPSLEVAEKITEAIGYRMEISPILEPKVKKSRLNEILKTLRELKPHLIRLGVRHVVVFGSVARQEDRPGSDIDLFLDFGSKRPGAAKMLSAEGKIIDAFDGTDVDIVTSLRTAKGQRLKIQIDKDGQRAF